MDENKINKEDEKRINSDKLSWEAPKLYSLDKGRTNGGEPTSYLEATAYIGS